VSTVTLEPRWRPTSRQRRLVTVAALALLSALVLGRPDLMLVAAPAIGALLAAHLRPAPRRLELTWSCGPRRVLEDEPITVEVTVRPPVARLAGDPALGGMPHESRFSGDAGSARWTITPGRWGRWRLGPLRLQVTAPGGLV
jgi:uncharacterized protein (DUF58 family)